MCRLKGKCNTAPEGAVPVKRLFVVAVFEFAFDHITFTPQGLARSRAATGLQVVGERTLVYVATGKRDWDKRQSIAERDANREAQRALAARNKGRH